MDNGDTQNFELDQFNLDTTSEDWSNSTSPERDNRNLGSKAISLPEASATPGSSELPDTLSTPNSQESPNAATASTEQISPSMPPGYEATPVGSADTTESATAIPEIDNSVIKTEEFLDARAIKVVDNAINKLNQDGDIANFYDTARDMVETNLKNSYNRELGA